ncbi:MAG: transcriptional repressor LexA [Patescibacteria group bacterium]|nr:MAG: transcriptional repressor LexA [Patescibacteria group bacterium]
MKKLTEKQKNVLDYITGYIKEHGISPTIEEIRLKLGFLSIRSVSQYLDALQSKGYINKTAKPRSIRIIDQNNNNKAETVLVPLLGMASCGTPAFYADNNIEGYMPVDAKLLKGSIKEHFLLKTSGNSMNKAGINDNELVLIRKKDYYESGERVVAVVDDKATIKKLHKGDQAVILSPVSTDKSHKPIMATEAAICGEVICAVPFFTDVQGNLSYFA